MTTPGPTLENDSALTTEEKPLPSGLGRVLRYTAGRLATLAITVVISVYLTILVANLGGYLDDVIRANIDFALGGSLRETLKNVEDPAERERIAEEARSAMVEAYGLNSPFMVRCFQWLWKGLTLDWGEGRVRILMAGTPSRHVRDIILDTLPRTLLVFGTANLLLFIASLTLGLGLSRRYGSRWDKLVSGLAPLAAVPSWAYGLIMTGLTLPVFTIFQSPFKQWPAEFAWSDLSFYLRVMTPPILALFLSKLFQGIYAWRTIFLVNSSEDYVEVGRAKGLPASMFERRYIMRPALPNILTSFAMLMVGLWQEIIILETVFNVAGIGQLFRSAIGLNDIRTIVGLVVTFAYLLAITVFLLDIAYVLVDPRVQVGARSQEGRLKRQGSWLKRLFTSRKLQGATVQAQPEPAPEAAPAPVMELSEQAPVPVEIVTEPVPPVPPPYETQELLLKIIEAGSGSGRRSMHQYVLKVGRRLVEAGALFTAGEVFWLTRAELIAALQALEAGQPLSPLGEYARHRRDSPQAASTPAAEAAIESPAPRPLTRSRRLALTLRELSHYPGAVVGAAIIMGLVLLSIYTMIAYPYNETTRVWRGDNFVWLDNPTYAAPAWVNTFRRSDLPTNISIDSRDPAAGKSIEDVGGGMRLVDFNFAFDYPYTEFPDDVRISFRAAYQSKKPLITLYWTMPDGSSTELNRFSIEPTYEYYLFSDEDLGRKLKSKLVHRGLFGDPARDRLAAMPGRYTLQVQAYVFEENADLDARMLLYGKAWGPAGTDSRRRDVMLALLWGTPVALFFGLVAAVLVTLSTLVISAVSTWFGGWVDELIQRLTEVNLILPFFPVSLMIYTLYSKSIWVILGVTVLLSVFGSNIKNYRSIFLQIKEEAYFEAARSYGAGDWRIIFRYMIPRISAIVIPQVMILVLSYVFLETALSILGLYDPLTPPTWGQLVLEGLNRGFRQGAYHLALEPAFLLILTGYAFMLLGTSLERFFEPRLRER
ncbi:MAG: ABC transporter permease subunit [Anaerolineales bacterium]|nr:ABC transporter permease subunit [Anaerolineales bacterium]